MTGRYFRIDPTGIRGDGIISRMPYHLYLYTENNPLNKIDPKGEFPFHGEFCGPSYGDIVNDTPWPKSVDGGLDLCCYEHDKCYNKKGLKPPYDPPWCSDNPDQIECDRELCNCLRKTSPPLKYIHKKWALRKAFGCIRPGNIIEIPF